MPWTTLYEKHGAEICYHGIVTGAEVLEAKRQFFAHEFPGGARFVLCDFGAAEQTHVSSPELEGIIAQDNAAIGSHPMLKEAIVAPKPLQFGLARMWQTRVDEVRPHTSVTYTRAEAITWLDGQGIRPLPGAKPFIAK